MQSLVVSNNVFPAKAGILLMLLGSLLFSACSSNTFETQQDLLDYIKDEDNGYIQHKSINGIDFTLMYRPTDLLVKQELGDEYNDDKIATLRNKYKQYMYFNLSMSKNNKELLSTAPKDRNEFGAMVNQLAFGMRDKVHMFTQSKDTLEMVDFVYPRMYGMSRNTTIMFVYPRDKEKLQEDILNFTIEDLGLYTGEVKFKLATLKIKNSPKLKLQKK